MENFLHRVQRHDTIEKPTKYLRNQTKWRVAVGAVGASLRANALRTRLPELRPAGSCGPEVLQSFAINLCSFAKHKFRSFPCSHAAKDNAVKQRVSTETVVAVHATCDLSCCVKASNWAALAHDLSFCVHFRTTHTIMNDRCNYRNVEWLRCYLVSGNDVVIKFLSASRRTTRSVPRLARWVCWPTTTFWIFRCFLRGLVVLLVAIHECLERDTHVLR